MIITITLNPALDRTLRIEHPLEVGKLNRSSSSHLEPGGKGINVSRAVKALGGNSIALGFTAGTNGRVMKREVRRRRACQRRARSSSPRTSPRRFMSTPTRRSMMKAR